MGSIVLLLLASSWLASFVSSAHAAHHTSIKRPPFGSADRLRFGRQEGAFLEPHCAQVRC
jgi:hypothetical protein